MREVRRRLGRDELHLEEHLNGLIGNSALGGEPEVTAEKGKKYLKESTLRDSCHSFTCKGITYTPLNTKRPAFVFQPDYRKKP